MLQLNLWDFLLRTVPEAFIINYGIILLSNEIGIKKYVISSLILSVSVVFIRMFPISFGVHIIINIIFTISIMTIAGVALIKSIYNTLLMYFLLSMSEFINILILNNFNINNDLNNPIKKLLLGAPSLFIMLIFLLIIKFISKKEEWEMSIIENLAFKFEKKKKKN